MTDIVGWIVAALLLGLWWGERQRRRLAERVWTTGSPDGARAERVMRPIPTAAQLTSPTGGEPADIPVPRRLVGDTLDRAAHWISRRAREQGHVVSDADARAAADSLFRQASGDE